MSRSRVEAQAALRKKERQTLNARRQKRKKAVIAIIVAVGMISAASAIALASNRNSRRHYDLTRVGQGIPAVVQVHDTTCPVCTELRSNISRIENDFDDSDLLVLIADVDKEEGLNFAARFTQHRRVTLLYFDPVGNLVDVQSGLQQPDELRSRFENHIDQHRSPGN
ncbi:thioredoxin family protein [Spirochaeta dissipatitropha]